MPEVDLKKDCPFCSQYSIKNAPNQWGSNWGKKYQQDSDIIYETDDLLLITGLGALSEGYVLILPKLHYLSMADLSEKMMDSLLSLKARVRAFLEKEYGVPVVFFEHGVRGEEARGGACIDHAHLHAVPCKADFRCVLSKDFSETKIYSLRDIQIKIKPNVQYILYEDGKEQIFVYQTQSKIPSQYIRRVWANVIGKPDEWDWSIYIGNNNIAKTLARFRKFT